MPLPPLLPHQRDALGDLERFAEGPGGAGLVVAPTGSGKSRLLATWLAPRVRRGERVLWVAHRRSLLEQACAELTRAVGRPAVLVTARLLPATKAGVVVASVGSLRTKPEAIRRWARQGPAWLVLDEAHHAPARSFRRLIETARRAGVRVIGATATPTRTVPAERATLSALFDSTVITRIPLQQLVERSVLARASLVRLASDTIADAGVTPAEMRRLARTGDLSPSWLRRLALVAPRNELVVSHLAEHRERYGPTIIFAHDVLHAALLTRRLRTRDFRVDYATGERPDGTVASITSVIQRFNSGELDVIVGVDALDEGVDLVRARTVILMRPTRSEIRLRQCIGRVLRGPALGGDPTSYVVLPEDRWERVAGFHSAIELVADTFAAPMDDRASIQSGRSSDLPDFARLATADEAITSHVGPIDGYFIELQPVGRILVSNGNGTSVVPVSAAQLRAWQSLLAELTSLSPRVLRSIDIEELTARHFSALDEVPPPAAGDVLLVIAHVQRRGGVPEIEPIDAVESPYALAHRIRERDMGEVARSALIRSAYAGTARHLFGSVDELRQSVDAVLTRLMIAS